MNFHGFRGSKRKLPFDLLATYVDTPHGVVQANLALKAARAAYPLMAWRLERTQRPARSGSFERIWLLIVRNPVTGEKAAVGRGPREAVDGLDLPPASQAIRPFKSPLAPSRHRRSGIQVWGPQPYDYTGGVRHDKPGDKRP